MFSTIKKIGKRGFSAMNLLPAIAISIVVGGVVLSIGATITNNVASDTPAYGTSSVNNSAKDAALNATKSIGEVSKNLPLLGLVAGLAVVLAIVIGAFAFGRK